jgi:hypothetical protein
MNECIHFQAWAVACRAYVPRWRPANSMGASPWQLANAIAFKITCSILQVMRCIEGLCGALAGRDAKSHVLHRSHALLGCINFCMQACGTTLSPFQCACAPMGNRWWKVEAKGEIRCSAACQCLHVKATQTYRVEQPACTDDVERSRGHQSHSTATTCPASSSSSNSSHATQPGTRLQACEQ